MQLHFGLLMRFVACCPKRQTLQNVRCPLSFCENALYIKKRNTSEEIKYKFPPRNIYIIYVFSVKQQRQQRLQHRGDMRRNAPQRQESHKLCVWHRSHTKRTTKAHNTSSPRIIRARCMYFSGIAYFNQHWKYRVFTVHNNINNNNDTARTSVLVRRTLEEDATYYARFLCAVECIQQ